MTANHKKAIKTAKRAMSAQIEAVKKQNQTKDEKLQRVEPMMNKFIESMQEKKASLEQKNRIQTEEIQQLSEREAFIKMKIDKITVNHKEEIKKKLNEWEESKNQKRLSMEMKMHDLKQQNASLSAKIVAIKERAASERKELKKERDVVQKELVLCAQRTMEKVSALNNEAAEMEKAFKERLKEYALNTLSKNQGVGENHLDHRRSLKSTMKHQRKHSRCVEEKWAMSAQIEILKKQIQNKDEKLQRVEMMIEKSIKSIQEKFGVIRTRDTDTRY